MGDGEIVNKNKLLETLRDFEKQAAAYAERLAEAGRYEWAFRQQLYVEAYTLIEKIVKDMGEDK